MLIEHFDAGSRLGADLGHELLAILLAVQVVRLERVAKIGETKAEQAVDVAEHEMNMIGAANRVESN